MQKIKWFVIYGNYANLTYILVINSLNLIAEINIKQNAVC